MGAATIEKLDEVWVEQHNLRWVPHLCMFCKHSEAGDYAYGILCTHPTRIANRGDNTNYNFRVGDAFTCDLWG